MKDFRRKEDYRPITYICSAYAGDTEGNTRKAREYCRFAVAKGAIPVAPHLLFPQFMDDSDIKERNIALHMGRILLEKSDEVWVFGAGISDGMSLEIGRAEKLRKKIRFFDDELKEVQK